MNNNCLPQMLRDPLQSLITICKCLERLFWLQDNTGNPLKRSWSYCCFAIEYSLNFCPTSLWDGDTVIVIVTFSTAPSSYYQTDWMTCFAAHRILRLTVLYFAGYQCVNNTPGCTGVINFTSFGDVTIYNLWVTRGIVNRGSPSVLAIPSFTLTCQ